MCLNYRHDHTGRKIIFKHLNANELKYGNAENTIGVLDAGQEYHCTRHDRFNWRLRIEGFDSWFWAGNFKPADTEVFETTLTNYG